MESERQALKNMEKDFPCPVCRKILCNTVVTGCGTKICRYCLTTYLKEKKCCPICRKNKCQNWTPYPQIDHRIASHYEKLGQKTRDERQYFINHRKLLQQKFDVEQETKAEKEMKRKLIEEKLKASTALESKRSDWLAICELKKYEIMCDIEKRVASEDDEIQNPRQHQGKKSSMLPAKNRYLLKSKLSNRSLPAKQQSSKKTTFGLTPAATRRTSTSKLPPSGPGVHSLLQKPQPPRAKTSNAKLPLTRTLSSLLKNSGTVVAPNFKTLAAVNEANQELCEELNQTYERLTTVAQKSESLEKNLGLAAGDHSTTPMGNKFQEITMTATTIPTSSAGSIIDLPKKPPQFQADYLLKSIDQVKNYLEETAIDALLCDNVDDSTLNKEENQESKQVKALLENILEIQLFLKKRLKEQEEVKQDKETQTEVQMCEVLGAAAEIIRAKYGNLSSASTSSRLKVADKTVNSRRSSRSNSSVFRR